MKKKIIIKNILVSQKDILWNAFPVASIVITRGGTINGGHIEA